MVRGKVSKLRGCFTIFLWGWTGLFDLMTSKQCVIHNYCTLTSFKDGELVFPGPLLSWSKSLYLQHITLLTSPHPRNRGIVPRHLLQIYWHHPENTHTEWKDHHHHRHHHQKYEQVNKERLRDKEWKADGRRRISSVLWLSYVHGFGSDLL